MTTRIPRPPTATVPSDASPPTEAERLRAEVADLTAQRDDAEARAEAIVGALELALNWRRPSGGPQ